MTSIKEYMKLKGLKQKELLKELKKLEPKLDKALMSKMVNGVVAPSPIVQEWLDKSVATDFNGLLEENGTITPLTYESCLKTKLEKDCFSILSNRENTSMDELAKALNIDKRTARRLISHMRAKGVRISGDGNGYNLCKTEEEYQRFRKVLASRAYNTLRVISAMDNFYEGQLQVK